MRRPLLLTGPPAAGKSSAARALAQQHAPSAVVEVDDLRQMVVAGAVAPWASPEGERQTRLAARHACELMSSFSDAGFAVVATDVLLGGAGDVYRRHAVRPLVVHLTVSLEESLRRAATRPLHLTDEELRHLHHVETGRDVADVDVDATSLSLAALTAMLADVWLRG